MADFYVQMQASLNRFEKKMDRCFYDLLSIVRNQRGEEVIPTPKMAAPLNHAMHGETSHLSLSTTISALDISQPCTEPTPHDVSLNTGASFAEKRSYVLSALPRKERGSKDETLHLVNTLPLTSGSHPHTECWIFSSEMASAATKFTADAGGAVCQTETDSDLQMLHTTVEFMQEPGHIELKPSIRPSLIFFNILLTSPAHPPGNFKHASVAPAGLLTDQSLDIAHRGTVLLIMEIQEQTSGLCWRDIILCSATLLDPFDPGG